MAAPALAMGAAGEASGSSFDALSAKMNVLVHLSNILSLNVPKMCGLLCGSVAERSADDKQTCHGSS